MKQVDQVLVDSIDEANLLQMLGTKCVHLSTGGEGNKRPNPDLCLYVVVFSGTYLSRMF